MMLKKKLLAVLVCPACRGKLKYRPLQKQLFCERDKLAYPVRKGVPVLTDMDATK
jgi:uncharacterized protein YbaR (Trm112 family)